MSGALRSRDATDFKENGGWCEFVATSVLGIAAIPRNTIAAIFIAFYFLIPSPILAESLGMTLSRNQVLQTCKAENSDRSGYVVFFHFQVHNGGHDAYIPSDLLRYQLPDQLTSIMADGDQIEDKSCPIMALSDFIDRAVSKSNSYGGLNTVIAKFPQDFSACFFSGLAKSSISIIAANGKVPGVVFCTPGFTGIDLCEVMFSRSTIGSDGSKSIVEGIEISPLRRDEVIELLSNFPQFPKVGNSEIEDEFLAMLFWVGEILSPQVVQIGIGE